MVAYGEDACCTPGFVTSSAPSMVTDHLSALRGTEGLSAFSLLLGYAHLGNTQTGTHACNVNACLQRGLGMSVFP